MNFDSTSHKGAEAKVVKRFGMGLTQIHEEEGTMVPYERRRSAWEAYPHPQIVNNFQRERK